LFITARPVAFIVEHPRALASVEQWNGATMVIKRRRVKQTQPLEVRLAEEVTRLREQAQLLPRGRLRDQVEKKAIQVEAAHELAELLRSPG
jgi:phage terminase Nu1 subunit (DNA packaging protein)